MKRNQCFNILKVQHFKDPIASLNRDRHSAKAPQPLNTLGKDAADASNTGKKKKIPHPFLGLGDYSALLGWEPVLK